MSQKRSRPPLAPDGRSAAGPNGRLGHFAADGAADSHPFCLSQMALTSQAFRSLERAPDLDELAARAVRLARRVAGAAVCDLELLDVLGREQRGIFSDPPGAGGAARRGRRRTFRLGQAGPTPLGRLRLVWPTGQPPSSTAVALLQLFVSHLEVLLERLLERERQEASLHALAIEATGQAGLDSVLTELGRRIMRLCRAECAGILLWDQEVDRLRVEVCVGQTMHQGDVGTSRCRRCMLCWPSGDALVGGVLAQRRPMLVEDVRTVRPSALSDVQSIIAAPMLLDDRPFGVLSLGHSRARAFTRAHLSLLVSLATDAARVIRSHQNRVAAEELALMTERNRIAQEIHDGVAQDLALLSMRAGLARDNPAEATATLADIRDILIRDIAELRRAVYALRPIDLEKMGLEAALRKLVADFGEQQRLRARVDIMTSLSDLHPRLQAVVFRLIQEALANAARHGQARTVEVRIEPGQAETLVVAVQDDGVGFQPEALPVPSVQGGMGLVHMRERLAAVGGSLAIDSEPGQGTTLTATLPMRLEQRDG